MIRSLLPFLHRHRHHQTLASYSTVTGRCWKKKTKKKRSNQTPPPDPALLSHAISSLPPRFTPSDLSLALSSLPDPRLAPHLLSWAHHHRPRPRPSSLSPLPFLTTIKILGRARLYDDLHSVASLALSLPIPLPEPLLNTIIYYYSESRMLFRALSVYNLMRDSPDPGVLPRPSLRTYNLLLSALLGPDRPSNSYIHHLYMDTLRALFRQMLDASVSPDIITLNFMIRGYVHSLHVNDALRVFHQMVPVYSVEPDGNTYGYLVHGLCAQGRTRNAREMYGEMKEKGFRASERAGNSLVSAMAMGGEALEAVGVMWEVVAMGRRVDGLTARTLVEGLCGEGRVREAEGLAREMWEREVVDGRMYRELVDGIREEYGGSRG